MNVRVSRLGSTALLSICFAVTVAQDQKWPPISNPQKFAGPAVDTVARTDGMVYVTGPIKNNNIPGGELLHLLASIDPDPLFVTGGRIVVLKYDKGGTLEDVSYYPTNDQFETAVPTDMAIDSAGDIYVTGHIGGLGTGGIGGEDPPGRDYITAKFDGDDGTVLWWDRFNSTYNADDFGMALGVDDTNNTVYVTGASENGMDNYDYYTIRYNKTTGGRVWEERWVETWQSEDIPKALAVLPGKGVYITGNYNANILTIGYNPDASFRLQDLLALGDIQEPAEITVTEVPNGSRELTEIIAFTGKAEWSGQLHYDAFTRIIRPASSDPNARVTRRYGQVLGDTGASSLLFAGANLHVSVSLAGSARVVRYDGLSLSASETGMETWIANPSFTCDRCYVVQVSDRMYAGGNTGNLWSVNRVNFDGSVGSPSTRTVDTGAEAYAISGALVPGPSHAYVYLAGGIPTPDQEFFWLSTWPHQLP